MSTIRVSLTLNVRDVGTFLQHLSPKQLKTLELAHGTTDESSQSAPNQLTGYSTVDMPIVKGDSNDSLSPKLEKVYQLHEKLEAQYGVGAITRRMLLNEARKKLKAIKSPGAAIAQLLKRDALRLIGGV